ncbi:MAG: sialate O-acetylesterase [Planctomycetaceae bacterium]|nr:sialate O-acetylesterase [Planctomycetaceae bacterium]
MTRRSVDKGYSEREFPVSAMPIPPAARSCLNRCSEFRTQWLPRSFPARSFCTLLSHAVANVLTLLLVLTTVDHSAALAENISGLGTAQQQDATSRPPGIPDAAEKTALPGDHVTEVRLPPKASFHLFVLAGQSNMAGRGVIEKQDTVIHPRLLMLNKQGHWVPAIAPLHFDKSVAGVGPGRTFGLELLKDDPTITIGLIPVAVGGSPISVWQPGEYYEPTHSFPWDDAVHRIRIGKRDGVVRGILWHQGESDSNEKSASAYQYALDHLINRLRVECDSEDQNGLIPFMAGQMGKFESRPWNEFKNTVDAAHRTLPDRVERTAFVDASALNHKGDNVHFDSESYRELGRRFASAYRRLRDND